MNTPKHYILLINPFSGNGKSEEAAEFIKKNLPDCTFSAIKSKYPSHFSEILQDFSFESVDTIIVIGGDGTLHDVINGLANRNDIPPIFLFPCGTGNAFNHDLECLDWETALEKLKKGKVQKIDIYKITEKNSKKITFGFNVAGWGLVSRINLLAEKLRFLGGIRYSVASFIYIFINPTFKAKIKIEDKEILDENFSFVLVCNNMYTGTGMKMAPLADFSDGLLDVLIIRKHSFLKLLMLFPKIFSGKHLDSPMVDYRKIRKISIDTEPLCLVVDGEIKAETPLEFEILDKRIDLIV
ncbi:diacylglycerol kinase family lipid kinase [Lacihabitans sp. LS3-19]|uniref:diacylglycerol/lipid kinase family protein n=1 Tax=Lacihabitans sp. LS3-19 TaxID=2487335 RepID=UPI0020CD2A44|nr:diacylglycerol kinase family protein [Lacihabitans sp. LS3-19]MCP9770872.1 diacylglycerol kinase family lipid kinase [Lacihabitans sp. LS3-19]